MHGSEDLWILFVLYLCISQKARGVGGGGVVDMYKSTVEWEGGASTTDLKNCGELLDGEEDFATDEHFLKLFWQTDFFPNNMPSMFERMTAICKSSCEEMTCIKCFTIIHN